MTETNDTEKPPGFFAASPWDAVAAGLGLLHFAAVLALLLAFRRVPLPAFLALATLYSLSTCWSLHGVAHNFIHNPFFSSAPLNRAFSLMLSLTMGFSQGIYRLVHLRHHMGNSDRPKQPGETKDPTSIYRYGHNGEAEPVLRYALVSFLRTDVRGLLAPPARTPPLESRWILAELALVTVVVVALTLYDWQLVLTLLPFWYLGHCWSQLANYYEHLGADPTKPIAWGVSCYAPLFNRLWLNNGYHAEHHFRAKTHWTELPALHRRIATDQQAAGVRVLSWPHPLGFFERGPSAPAPAPASAAEVTSTARAGS